MKKIYLMAAFIGASTFAFNQALQIAPALATIKKADKTITLDTSAPKALGTSIWSSNFSTATDWSIGGNGSQGAWQIGVEADFQNPAYFSTITSTTATNGFAFFEGIGYLLASNVSPQNAWITMSNSINCSTESIVTFKFEQAYRAFNYDKTYVEVSLDDGLTWQQTIDINPSITANTSATETVVMRNFNVNNSTAVKFRFRWESSNPSNTAGSGYAWQVDDVNILTLSDHDIAINNYTYGTTTLGETLHYYQIPLAQTAPIESSAVLKNLGSQNQTNVVFSATESVNSNYTGSSAPITLASGANDSVVVTTNFTPSAIGNYQLDYAVTYNNTDDNPVNNTVAPYKFSVGTSIFARDSSTLAETGVLYGSMSGANQTPASAIQVGNVYTMKANASLTGIDFQFGTVVLPGGIVYGEILDGNLDPIANGETLPYTVVANDENSYHTLAFSAPLNLIAGERYVITVKSFDTDFSVATAGKSAPQTTYIYYNSDATWYYTTSTPVVRMNFGSILSSSKSAIANLIQIVGTPSAADSFDVSGSNLTDDITVVAPTNFEIANTLAGPYGTNLTYTNSGGTLAPSKVYVRLNGPNVNPAQAGNIVISTAGSNNKLVALSGKTLAECDVDISTTVSNSVTITANASGFVYQWFDCDNDTEIAGETGQSYTATVNGNYSVIITDGPCIDTSACVAITSVSLTDNEFAGVAVYPNPVQEVLKVTSENGLLESVEIITAAGRVVYTSTISSNDFEINTTNFSNGVYFVNLRTDKSIKTFKVIK